MNKISPQFLDFQIIQSILPRFGKRNLETLIDQKLGHSYENLSPAERVFFLEKLAEKWDYQSEIEKNNLKNIFEMEHIIGAILYKMEKE